MGQRGVKEIDDDTAKSAAIERLRCDRLAEEQTKDPEIKRSYRILVKSAVTMPRDWNWGIVIKGNHCRSIGFGNGRELEQLNVPTCLTIQAKQQGGCSCSTTTKPSRV